MQDTWKTKSSIWIYWDWTYHSKKNAHEIIIRMVSTAIFMRIYAFYTSLPLEYTKGNLWMFRFLSYKTESDSNFEKMDFEIAEENHSINFPIETKI